MRGEGEEKEKWSKKKKKKKRKEKKRKEKTGPAVHAPRPPQQLDPHHVVRKVEEDDEEA